MPERAAPRRQGGRLLYDVWPPSDQPASAHADPAEETGGEAGLRPPIRSGPCSPAPVCRAAETQAPRPAGAPSVVSVGTQGSPRRRPGPFTRLTDEQGEAKDSDVREQVGHGCGGSRGWTGHRRDFRTGWGRVPCARTSLPGPGGRDGSHTAGTLGELRRCRPPSGQQQGLWASGQVGRLGLRGDAPASTGPAAEPAPPLRFAHADRDRDPEGPSPAPRPARVGHVRLLLRTAPGGSRRDARRPAGRSRPCAPTGHVPPPMHGGPVWAEGGTCLPGNGRLFASGGLRCSLRALLTSGTRPAKDPHSEAHPRAGLSLRPPARTRLDECLQPASPPRAQHRT